MQWLTFQRLTGLWYLVLTLYGFVKVCTAPSSLEMWAWFAFVMVFVVLGQLRDMQSKIDAIHKRLGGE